MEKTGADFTNSFRYLSCLPLPSSPNFEAQLAEVKAFLISQSCTAEDLKKAFKPRMDPRYLLQETILSLLLFLIPYYY